MRSALVLTFAMAALPCAAAVHKCTDARGRVTYQDEPCRTSQSPAPVDTSDAFRADGRKPTPRAAPTDLAPPDPAYGTFRGAWRGPAQFNFNDGGGRVADAHSIGALVLELIPNGKAEGVVDTEACRISGLFTQFVTPRSASLDLTFKGCRDERFNRRYSGHLHVNPGAREATLRLHAMQIAPTAPLAARTSGVTQASIDAVLRR